ncbi:zinc ABC transporter substrate-binding protein [Sagittula sp. SSi028]|uniref:zinc ABC transporter substrate-binding protein n=1 Tax=Sagittula sp. SSi028 TaxID=3400636 RepID=UPI003AF7038D
MTAQTTFRNVMYATTFAAALGLGTASRGLADIAQSVTDIPPVSSLVAMVVGDTDAVVTLWQPGTSAHDIALRPSQARAMRDAGLIVWIGPDLAPGLTDQFAALAGDTPQIILSEVAGTQKLAFREGSILTLGAPHDHGHDDHAGHDDDHGHDDHAGHDDDHGHDDHADHDDDHGHDDHADHDDDHGHDDHAGHEDDHGHEDHAGHDDDHGHDDHSDHDDDHGHEKHDEHHHDDANFDPHLWLSPDNAVLWLDAIATELGRIDPDNAETYSNNAQAGIERIRSATATAQDALSGLGDATFATTHDALQYYEAAFGLTMAGAMSDGDDAMPGPARLAALREHLGENPPACILMEPGADTRLLAAIAADDIPRAEVDILGANLEPGADLYPTLIEKTAADIAACAAE